MQADRGANGFLEQVRRRAALRDGDRAVQAAGVALSALAHELLVDERRLLVRALGEQWRWAVLPDTPRDVMPVERRGSVERVYRRVAAAEDVEPGFAREHAQAVYAALAAVLDHETAARLRSALPEPLAELLVEPERGDQRAAPSPPDQPNHVRARHGAGDTLSSGRPGSSRPLSETRPRQAGSLLEEEHPRDDTKISSAPGVTADREEHTLSSGRPGADRPLSESGED